MVSPAISVIIPTYNEEHAIAPCLDALLVHQHTPFEIIVVDNNSDDATCRVVEQYMRRDPRVRMLREPRQGLVPTRDHGVREARGDIVARIDADTRVDVGWAEAIGRFFAVAPDDVVGGSGFSTFYDMPWQKPFRNAQETMNRRIATRLARGEVTEIKEIFGANQVMRASGWQAVAGRTSERTDIMEDTDLSITVRSLGLRLAMIPDMRVTISGRRLRSSPAGYRRYTACSPRTYALHGRRRAAVAAWIGIQFARALQVLLWIALRRWDPETCEFRPVGPITRELERVVP